MDDDTCKLPMPSKPDSLLCYIVSRRKSTRDRSQYFPASSSNIHTEEPACFTRRECLHCLALRAFVNCCEMYLLAGVRRGTVQISQTSWDTGGRFSIEDHGLANPRHIGAIEAEGERHTRCKIAVVVVVVVVVRRDFAQSKEPLFWKSPCFR